MVLLAGAAMFAAWRAIGTWAGLPGAETKTWIFVLVTGFAALMVAAISGLIILKKRPGLAEAAEFLDDALHSKNQVATALEFSAGKVAEGFALAAIEDGVRVLEQNPVDPEFRTEAGELRRRTAPTLLLALLGFVVGHFLPMMGVRPAVAHSPEVEGDRSSRPAGTPDGTPVAKSPLVRKGAETTALRSPQAEPERRSGATSGQAPRGRDAAPNEDPPSKPAEGRPGEGRSGKASESKQSSSAVGDATTGEAAAPEKSVARPGDRRPKSADVRMQPNSKPENREPPGSTAGQSGTGGGSMSPVRSAWNQKDQSSDSQAEENPTDERIEEESSEDEARAGTQPGMKDRRGATSRELSISAMGEGGDGRGGPSEPKKARGTASMVLGVPIPDFVRGLLNPGTTKVTHERVQPKPTPTSPSAAHPAAKRQGLEVTPTSRRVPDEFRGSIQSFQLEVQGLLETPNR